MKISQMIKEPSSSLTEHCRVATFDLRGHGNSDKPDHADAYASGEQWADHLNSVMETAGLRRPTLVGWSLLNQEAQISLYPESGHAPFYDEPERFNRELAGSSASHLGDGHLRQAVERIAGVQPAPKLTPAKLKL